MNYKHIPAGPTPVKGDTHRMTECGRRVPAQYAPSVLYKATPERFITWAVIVSDGAEFDLRCPDCASRAQG